jgi:hypothetical protein
VTTLADAQHEAAHIVVGVALGLRLRRAYLCDRKIGRYEYLGWTEWEPKPWPREAGLIMTAAGLAWERACGDLVHARSDTAELRRAGVRGNARVRVLERAAWAILAGRPALHVRLTRALLEGEVTGAAIRALARGELM